MADDWRQMLAKHDRFLKEGKGHFLILSGFNRIEEPARRAPGDILGCGTVLSEDFLRTRAYDLGVETCKWFEHEARMRPRTDDDSITCMSLGWGTGVTACCFTGGNAVFEECTSYSTDTFVKTWDDIDRLRFDPDNRWVRYCLEYWRGVAAVYSGGVALTPHDFRSPLDLANDLRGNRLFMDMYDAPDQVDRLVDACTTMIIEAIGFMRREIPLLAHAPSGVWGMATSSPDMIFINGDPIDLVSVEMGERFNHPYIERLAAKVGPVFFHHHTLGVSRVSSVSRIRGIIVQNFIYDRKCPKILDILDDEWIEASNRVPIHVCQNLTEAKDLDAVLEKMSRGRFIVQCHTATREECERLIAKVRSYDR